MLHWESLDDGTTLAFNLASCNEADLELTVDESHDVIVVAASAGSEFGCAAEYDDCSDARSVDLNAPLGDRRIVDEDGIEIPHEDEFPLGEA